jgi:hypothetical protein
MWPFMFSFHYLAQCSCDLYTGLDFFLKVSNILWCQFTTFNSAIRILIVTRIISTFHSYQNHCCEHLGISFPWLTDVTSLRSEFLVLYCFSVFNLWGNARLLSQTAELFYISTRNTWGIYKELFQLNNEEHK